MEARYLHVFLERGSDVSHEQVEEKFNSRAIDWNRYSKTCWILYTESSLERWKGRIRPLIGSDGSYFICEIDVNQSAGFMPKLFWEWLGSHEKS